MPRTICIVLSARVHGQVLRPCGGMRPSGFGKQVWSYLLACPALLKIILPNISLARFRRLFVIFSSYTYVNTLRRIHV